MDERDAAARRKVTDRANGRQPSGFSGGHRSPEVRSKPAVGQGIDARRAGVAGIPQQWLALVEPIPAS